MAWHAPTPNVFIRFFSSDASPIAAPSTVNTVVPTATGGISCAALSDGTGIAVWSPSTSSYQHILARPYSASGMPLATPLLVNYLDTTSGQGNPSVAAFPGLPSSAHVAWQWASGGVYKILDSVIFPGNATALPSQVLNQNTSIAYQQYPSAAAFTNGNGVVVWEKGSYNIVGRIISPSGIPQGNEFQVPTNTTVQQSAASIAGLIDGTALVVFGSGLDGNNHARSFSSDGTALNSEFPIPNNPFNQQQGRASLAGILNGNATDAKALVAWYGTLNGGSHNIYGRYVSSLVPVSPTPTPTPTVSPTPTPTPLATPTPTPSPTPTSSPTPTPTVSRTPTPSPTPTSSPTTRPTPSIAPAISPTPASVPSSASSLRPAWLSFPRDVVSYFYRLYKGA